MNNNRECTFLGTCAADFGNLKKADYNDRFDNDARRSSCMMIGDNILIDCGFHTMDSLRIAKKDISEITDLFITHFHADHFIKEHAEMIADGKATPLRLWCRRDASVPQMKNVDVIRMEEGEYYHEGTGTNAKAVYANHEESSFPQHYVFCIDGVKMMYATDGGWMTTRAIQYLKKNEIDILIIDATCGECIGEYRIFEHNSLPMLRMMIPSLKKIGAIKKNGRIYLTHVAPSLHKPHYELQESVKEDGFIVAYDGMTFTI